MVALACALKARGHDVRLITYFDDDHFRGDLARHGVAIETVNSNSRVGRLWHIRRAVRRQLPDAVVSFLDTPNFYSLFSALPPTRLPLIVSERNFNIGGKTWRTLVRFNLFRLATHVVTNTHAQREFVCEHYPFLRASVSTVVNCVDLTRFQPQPNAAPPAHGSLSLVVIASIMPRKNAKNLVAAVHEAREVYGVDVTVDWFGGHAAANDGAAYYSEMTALIDQLGLADSFRFRGVVSDLHKILPRYDACCHPSFQEGCANAICESLACGLPCLVSDSGDNRILVAEPTRGIRFDPNNASSIARAIHVFASLRPDVRNEMRQACRDFAEEALSPSRFADEYETLLVGLV